MNNLILKIEGLTKSYGKGEGKSVILENTTLEIAAGESVALVAPSGTGKSTLLHIAGLLDDYDKGEITINAAKCAKLSDEKKSQIRRDNIGFIYQSHNLFADFTALENVAIPLMMRGAKREDAEKQALAFLDKLGLKHRANGKAGELSGGEAQRTAIARALISKPKLLLADEPTGNLDPVNSRAVFDLLLKLIHEEGMSAIIATHNPELAKLLDRKITINDKRISAA
ncbi:MAG: ABC transporter ATP-binding protein [Alphaproteobacteria bacterium]|nr:ABC transporter ATP-binding protein [Alphaproteobacteria bacterium]